MLRLRRLAYQHAKKVSADAKDVDMGDGFDNCSRILVAKHRGRIVGTVRLMFPQTATDPLKHQDFLPLPPDLPPRDRAVEVSKACTHPGYRGSDIFYSLLKHTALTAIQAGRRYGLMSATDSLAPIYQRFGPCARWGEPRPPLDAPPAPPDGHRHGPGGGRLEC